MQLDTNEYPGYRQTAEIAQDTMTRIIINVAYTFNQESQGINVETLSPTIGHIVRAAERYLLTAVNSQNRQWLEDFDQLRRVLSLFDRRWRLAGRFKDLSPIVCFVHKANFCRHGTASSECEP